MKTYKGRFDGNDITVAGKVLDSNRIMIVDWAAGPHEVMDEVNAILRKLKSKAQFVEIDDESDSHIYFLKK